jgi:Tol biopolymer transport system component
MKTRIISFGLIFILLSLLMGCGLTTSSKIVFHSARDGNHEIYVMNADGTGQTRLTDNKAMDYLPMWSPDRKKVVFVSERDGNHEIYVMNADGTGQTRLTTGTYPVWSYVSSWSW